MMPLRIRVRLDYWLLLRCCRSTSSCDCRDWLLSAWRDGEQLCYPALYADSSAKYWSGTKMLSSCVVAASNRHAAPVATTRPVADNAQPASGPRGRGTETCGEPCQIMHRAWPTLDHDTGKARADNSARSPSVPLAHCLTCCCASRRAPGVSNMRECPDWKKAYPTTSSRCRRTAAGRATIRLSPSPGSRRSAAAPPTPRACTPRRRPCPQRSFLTLHGAAGQCEPRLAHSMRHIVGSKELAVSAVPQQ